MVRTQFLRTYLASTDFKVVLVVMLVVAMIAGGIYTAVTGR